MVAWGSNTSWSATSAAVHPASAPDRRQSRRPTNQMPARSGKSLMFAARAIPSGVPIVRSRVTSDVRLGDREAPADRDAQQPRPRSTTSRRRSPRIHSVARKEATTMALPDRRGGGEREERQRPKQDREQRRVEVRGVLVDVLARRVERLARVQPRGGVVVRADIGQRVRGQVAQEDRDPAERSDGREGEQEQVHGASARRARAGHGPGTRIGRRTRGCPSCRRDPGPPPGTS